MAGGGRGEAGGGPVLAVLCSDIVGSTELYASLGDVAAHALIAGHDEVIRQVLAGHGGRRVKGLGDGVLAVFDSPRAAIRAALELRVRRKRPGSRQTTTMPAGHGSPSGSG